MRSVGLPPEVPPGPDGTRQGGWWHESDEGRIICDLCPRACALKPGDRGFCFVRQNVDGEMLLTTYGRSTGFCIDPIEKKPLNHFYPGTSVLSFGTAGCNLGCKFCQNWEISKVREVEALVEHATPEMVARAARELGCRSVAFTYNDPVIWAEYAIDVARACREQGVKTVAVTAGYISPAARGPFYSVMDAANVDLKGFTEDFYQRYTLSHLQPVLDLLGWLRHETDVWFELTNLVIPQANDALDEVRQMCEWILSTLGPDVPIHFTAFHPDFRLRDRPATPPETLVACYEAARRAGLNQVYVGNVHDVARQSTYCGSCRGLVIERVGYTLGQYHLNAGRCRHCGATLPGRFDVAPGSWGSRRQPVRMADFAPRVISGPTPMSLPTLPPVVEPPAGNVPSAVHDRALLAAAAGHLTAPLLRSSWQPADPTLAGLADKLVWGAFVSVKRRGQLRSCCGFLGQEASVAQAVQLAAARTALDDPRFPPISPGELPYLDLEVWLLDQPRLIAARGAERAAQIIIGRHGVQIARGEQSGLLLPGVATDHGWNAEQFLDQVCIKAGLPPRAWRDDDATRLATFEGHVARGAWNDCGVGPLSLPPLPLTQAELITLARNAGQNVLNMLRGAVASPYVLGIPDGHVCGVILLVEGQHVGQRVDVQRLDIRPSLPLQSTLHACAEGAAQMLAQQPNLDQWLQGLRIGLSVLTDPMMHGSVAEPDLRGFLSNQRALIVIEQGRAAWLFDPTRTPDMLYQELVAHARVAQPATAALQSFAISTTESRILLPQRAAPQPGGAIRPPAQAGRFYPADRDSLDRLLDEHLASPTPAARPCAAVMVPHAGLVYSGRLAAQVLRQTQLPETIIILGPKHTPHGVDWAIAPHEQWQLPNGTLAADPGLARELAAAIPGLELDAAAHAQEHAIEVELPWIVRLAPRAKVVGIALGSCDVPRAERFAAGLAEVLGRRPSPPLLVISSDMNHFADDEQTRRLDRLALDALRTGEPRSLLETVQRHAISMCGVWPAFIVLETLRRLGRLHEIIEVGYSTSADVNGDRTRVVGYAGALIP